MCIRGRHVDQDLAGPLPIVVAVATRVEETPRTYRDRMRKGDPAPVGEPLLDGVVRYLPDPTEVENLLRQVLSRDDLDAILLTGGTGISPRDGTYEVVSCLLDKQISGFGEIFRFLSYQDIGSSAVMSRAQAGVAAGKVVISLPGSRGAVDLGMRRLVLPELGHMVSQVHGI
ncbi:MAG: molybdenum cofactor biosynthesis protein [Deltaproteobacteria bacterium]|nr:molybdenum cofactor biosynthesis protein [Deltaproteobacteria bacterium]